MLYGDYCADHIDPENGSYVWNVMTDIVALSGPHP